MIFSYFPFSSSPDWPISEKENKGSMERVFNLPLGSVWEEWGYGPSSRFSFLSAFCQSWSWRPPCLYLESSSLEPPSEQGEHHSVYLRYRHASKHTQSSSVNFRGAEKKHMSERVERWRSTNSLALIVVMLSLKLRRLLSYQISILLLVHFLIFFSSPIGHAGIEVSHELKYRYNMLELFLPK